MIAACRLVPPALLPKPCTRPALNDRRAILAGIALECSTEAPRCGTTTERSGVVETVAARPGTALSRSDGIHPSPPAQSAPFASAASADNSAGTWWGRTGKRLAAIEPWDSDVAASTLPLSSGIGTRDSRHQEGALRRQQRAIRQTRHERHERCQRMPPRLFISSSLSAKIPLQMPPLPACLSGFTSMSVGERIRAKQWTRAKPRARAKTCSVDRRPKGLGSRVQTCRD